LHFHARHGVIPLGGSTVFVRTNLVRATGGWDDECLAEDCELGIRLSSLGATTVVAYSPDLVTREETPVSIHGLFRQRIRWDQGFLQVLRKRDWAKLPTARQRWFARYTLAMPFIQAASWLVIPIEAATVPFLHLPIALAVLTFALFVPFAVTVALDTVAYAEFCAAYGVPTRKRDYVSLVISAPPYQIILAAAAAAAVVREIKGQRGWDQTEHIGAHRRNQTIALLRVVASAD
jgi:cellulose synthase/poly-beta-1,6-N-acetylglucosamine synthase-like glycosyltransferase